LSICYGIINNMGGNISVASAVDGGTTFTIHVPIKPDKPVADDPDHASAAPN
jgi:two-component system NtrC family sensor kinase